MDYFLLGLGVQLSVAEPAFDRQLGGQFVGMAAATFGDSTAGMVFRLDAATPAYKTSTIAIAPTLSISPRVKVTVLGASAGYTMVERRPEAWTYTALSVQSINSRLPILWVSSMRLSILPDRPGLLDSRYFLGVKETGHGWYCFYVGIDFNGSQRASSVGVAFRPSRPTPRGGETEG